MFYHTKVNSTKAYSSDGNCTDSNLTTTFSYMLNVYININPDLGLELQSGLIGSRPISRHINHIRPGSGSGSTMDR